jgi:hypothetical protein
MKVVLPCYAERNQHSFNITAFKEYFIVFLLQNQGVDKYLSVSML